MKLLNGLKVANLTTRLPGPLGCQLLSDLGAKVVKWEDSADPDAFIQSELAQKVAEFSRWYRVLNQQSRVRSYSSEKIADREWVAKNLSSFQALLLPVSRRREFKQLISHWRKLPGLRITLEIGGKIDGGPMQDLIALAQAGILNKKQTALPEVPLAGILFGHQIALELLALWIQALKSQRSPKVQRLFLEGQCQKNLRFLNLPIENVRPSPLHHGSTPCYNLYKLKDGRMLALACIEKKHYLEVQNALGLPVLAEHRLSHKIEEVEKMKIFFSKLKAETIRKKISTNTPGIFIFPI